MCLIILASSRTEQPCKEQKQTFSLRNTDSVNSVVFTEDGKKVVSGSDDTTLKVWSLEGWMLERTLTGHRGRVNSVTLTGDSKRIVSGSNDETLKVWNFETGELERTLEGHSNRVMSVVLTEDGKRAVSGSYDRTLKVWNLETGELISSLTLDAPVLSVSLYDADRTLTIIVGDAVGSVYCFDLK